MKTKIQIISSFFVLLLLGACISYEEENLGNVEGYKPVYADNLASEVLFLAPMDMVTPGKIYVFGNYLFVNERLEGVHVINNADPSNPVTIAFIQIPGNVDIAVRDYVLYADNYTDLIAIDLSDINNLKVCDREENVFETLQDYPNVFGVYFECVDKTNGVVIGWTQTTINNPKCST